MKLNYKRAYLKELDRSKKLKEEIDEGYNKGKAEGIKHFEEKIKWVIDKAEKKGRAEALKEMLRAIEDMNGSQADQIKEIIESKIKSLQEGEEKK